MSKVKLGDVARESSLRWSVSMLDVPIVGLEHIDPQEMKLTRWDMNCEHTFTKKFCKGQILLGRRRAYQKKACVATCDGICSGDITVIEEIPGKILPELLPFIIQNDAFFDYAVAGSAGSLSPRVKWDYLAKYEFDLPDLATQKSLAEKLWAAYDLKEKYKKLLAATDEMVKSQFIEMFGRTESVPLSFYAESLLGGVSLAGGSDSSHKVITTGAVTTNYFKETEYKFLPDDYIPNEAHLINQGDVIVCRKNSLDFVGNAAYIASISTELYLSDLTWKIVFNSYAIPHFVWQALVMPNAKQQIRNMASGTCGSMRNITKPNLLKVLLPKATIQEQRLFISIAEQADKSKFELRKSIEAIDKVIKSLFNENNNG